VRVNPGNYADRKQFKILEYTDTEYNAELERVREKFVPLIRKMKKNGVALRIGTNHGSLSDRIMNRFGDTPKGMMMSALEFVEIAESEGFKDIVISMKSSIPAVMIEAYRELVFEMNKRGMDYPLHLGVTEAGEGVDGRIKSAIGIGTLLQEGLGDTIRVSLTEPPEREVPVAFDLLK
jgi:(E)-4-hydroxy-3-methylbut-2-enyl-diphosphate synthase